MTLVTVDSTANDKSYADIFFNGGNSGVDPAWDAIAGSAIGTSAAVASGVAYMAIRRAGHGRRRPHRNPLWTWQDPSGEPIDGAPTIDPRLEQVVVGTADGSVVALTTAGTLRWMASLTGSANAPVVSGGLVYVSSSNGPEGAVTAFAESTGALSWSYNLPGPATSAVAVDPTGGVVAVGGTDGTLTALSSSDGSSALDLQRRRGPRVVSRHRGRIDLRGLCRRQSLRAVGNDGKHPLDIRHRQRRSLPARRSTSFRKRSSSGRPTGR